MKLPETCRLYGILDLGYVPRNDAIKVAQEMLTGGIDILQLRAKQEHREVIRDLALQLAPLCKEAGVPFILNDYPDLVLETGADGVHIGQDDIPVAEARRVAGPHAIVGLSTHSIDQALAAESAGPDYIGFGPLFATPTKPDYTPIGLHDIVEVHRRLSLPIFCIGGVKLENLEEVLAAGAKRVVIVSGILKAQDISKYCRDCLKRLAL